MSIPFVLSSRGYGLLWNSPPSAGSSSRRTRPAGRPARRARSTTGSPPPRPRGDPRPVRRRHRSRARAARLGQRVLAVQAPLPHPGRAPRRGPRVPPPRPAAVGDRRRLLPLVRHGRLPLRPGRVARPGRHGRRAAGSSASSSWCRSGPRSPRSARTTASSIDRGLLVGADQGRGVPADHPGQGHGRADAGGVLRPHQPADRASASGAWLSATTCPAASASSGLTPASRSSIRPTPATCPSTPDPARRSRASTRATTPGSSPTAWPPPDSSDRAALPLGLGRIAAVRGSGLVRGHPGHLGIAPPAGPRRA